MVEVSPLSKRLSRSDLATRTLSQRCSAWMYRTSHGHWHVSEKALASRSCFSSALFAQDVRRSHQEKLERHEAVLMEMQCLSSEACRASHLVMMRTIGE
eukprot:3467139-Amphidinium_carterae.1